MNLSVLNLKIVFTFFVLLICSCKISKQSFVKIPFRLDNNRMLVKGEIKRPDGTYRKITIWVDTGNPDLLLSEELAMDIGVISNNDRLRPVKGMIAVTPPKNLNIGGMKLNLTDIRSYAVVEPFWLFKATKADANLPSSALMNYDVVFDYPGNMLLIKEKGEMKFTGLSLPACINEKTGIVQIDGMCCSDTFSFAIDNGASYTFGSTEFLTKIRSSNPDLKTCRGAIGCANMWGWSPFEDKWDVISIPELKFGDMVLKNIGMTVPPDFNNEGLGIMDFYSQKSAKPVDGFLGPNLFKEFAVGIDYANRNVYLKKKATLNPEHLDIVGITVRPEENGNYTIIGVVNKEEVPDFTTVLPGDVLLQVDDLKVTGLTMGRVIDSLRGNPGDYHDLIVLRNGIELNIRMVVERYF